MVLTETEKGDLIRFGRADKPKERLIVSFDEDEKANSVRSNAELINELKDKGYSKEEIKNILSDVIEEERNTKLNDLLSDLYDRYIELLDREGEMDKDDFDIKKENLQDDIDFFLNLRAFKGE